MATFYPQQYGAKADGKTKDTASLQAAIDACAASGGGRVSLENGCFYSGTLYLKNGVELHIDASSTLLASGDIADYAEDTHHNRYTGEPELDRCFLYAEDAQNIALTGRGTIDGNAESFPNPGSIHRPMLVRFLRCSHIRLESLRLYNAAAWTVAVLDSVFIWAEGLDIQNSKRYNGDGLDFDGCREVFVQNCHIKGTDDNLCLQAGSKQYPTENVHITGCSFSSICAGIRIGLKSVGAIRNVAISSCTFHNIWREGVKIECSEGGSITDISLDSLVMRNVRRPLFILLNNRLSALGSTIGLTGMPPVGTLARIRVNGLTATDDAEMQNTHLRFGNDLMGSPAFAGIRIDAPRTHPIKGLTLRCLTYTFTGGGKLQDVPGEWPEVVDLRQPYHGPVAENYWPTQSRAAFADIRNVTDLVLDDLKLAAITPDERPPVIIENCTGRFGPYGEEPS